MTLHRLSNILIEFFYEYDFSLFVGIILNGIIQLLLYLFENIIHARIL